MIFASQSGNVVGISDREGSEPAGDIAVTVKNRLAKIVTDNATIASR